MCRLTKGLFLTVALPLLLAFSAALPHYAAAQALGRTSGFYANQIIQYVATDVVTAQSPVAAIQISKGQIVFHVVGDDGVSVPAVQLSRLLAALPDLRTDGNVLNFVPPPQELGHGRPGELELGYTGGAWNLQIFGWNPGVTPTELSSAEDITAAVALGRGTLTATRILVRCPVNDFSLLRFP